MIKRSLLISMILICMSATTIAYAGSLNSYEQDVVVAAEGTFDYEGTSYKLASSYKNQLKDYLMAEDVDLTKEQRDSIISSINGYIETGVKEGYLVPVSAAATTGQNTNSVPSKSQEPEISPEVTGITGNPDVAEQTPQVKDTGNSTDNSLEDLLDTVVGAKDSNSQDTSNKDSASIDGQDDNLKAVDQGIISDLEEKENTVIKSTGFDFSPTIAMAVFMGFIMLISMIVTVRYHYFTRSDE